MNENFYNQDFLIRYLLEDLPEAEASKFEDAFFADDLLFERLEIAENDLADDYARGKLAAEQKEKFETIFLNSPARRRKLEVSALLYEAAEKTTAADLTETSAPFEREKNALVERPSWRQKFQALFRAPQLVAAFAALLILFGGAWFVWRNSRSTENLIAERKTPVAENSPSVVNNTPPAANDLPNATPNKSSAPVEISNNAIKKNGIPTPEPKVSPTPAIKTPQPVFAFLALATGGVRGDSGKAKTLALSANTTAARLRLAFDAGDFANYNVVVRTVDGKEIWRGKAAKSAKSQSAAPSVTVEIPARQLPAGDYLVTLSGAGKTGANETIDEYYFTVKR